MQIGVSVLKLVVVAWMIGLSGWRNATARSLDEIPLVNLTRQCQATNWHGEWQKGASNYLTRCCLAE